MYQQKPNTSLVEDLEVLGLLTEGDKKQKVQEMEHGGMHGGMAPDDEEEEKAKDPAAPPPAPKPEAPAAPPPPAPKPEGEEDEEKPQDMSYDSEMAAYEAAWDCVKKYYSLAESKEKLSEDDYRTVINAFSFIVETMGKYMGPDILDKDPNELPGGEPKWAGDAEYNPSEKVQGTNAPRRPRGWKYHDASPRPGEKAESLDALVGELKQLTQEVTNEDEDMQALGNKIIEGFESIRDTAQGVAERIAAELKESKEEVTQNHPRVKLGKYFEGVANDAKLILRAIAERDNTDVDDAIEDLNSLAADLKKGLGAL